MMKRVYKLMTLAAATVFATLGTSSVALAEEAAGGGSTRGIIALAAGLAISIAAFGCALGQGRAVASAMESIGRNPNSASLIQTPMIIGLALIEALCIYALVIAFTIAGNI
jgi:F-type H+-transporting ATPase subunit c